MSSWISASLLESPNTFDTFQNCHAFRSSIQFMPNNTLSPLNADKQNDLVQRRLNSELEVLQYLDDINDCEDEADICILAFESQSPASQGLIPLPLSCSLFQIVANKLRILPDYLAILDSGAAIYLSPSIAQDESEWEDARFILQQNTSYSCFSIALSFDIRTGRMRVLIFGAQSWSISEFFACLRSASPLPFGPTFIPSIALELQAKWFNETVFSCGKKIREIENCTGMRKDSQFSPSKNDQIQDWKNLDLVDVARELSSILSRIAFFKLQAKTAIYLVEGMQKSVEALKTLPTIRKDSSRNEFQKKAISKLEYIHSLFFGLKSRCNYLHDRAYAQFQIVCSLIASQDSSTSLEIAQASRDLAKEARNDNRVMQMIVELGRQDNLLMLQVAEDSRAAAAITAQDSATMRIIAGVTVFFLPATFAASLFSMTFFDFLEGEAKVSPWIWLYVILTIGLTIMIQSIWVILSKQKEKSVMKRVNSVPVSSYQSLASP